MPSDEVITHHWGNCLTRLRLAIKIAKIISVLVFVSFESRCHKRDLTMLA
jgi:hypothetical protein